ncbi:hypothetical protein [Bartonella saheliensis]
MAGKIATGVVMLFINGLSIITMPFTPRLGIIFIIIP